MGGGAPLFISMHIFIKLIFFTRYDLRSESSRVNGVQRQNFKSLGPAVISLIIIHI